MNNFKFLPLLIIFLIFSGSLLAEIDYRGIKTGMTMSEVTTMQGIKKSGWTGGLSVNFKKFFGKGNTPPGLKNVYFQFSPKSHGEKLWRITLRFTKIDAEKIFVEGGLIEESAQKAVIEFLYPNAEIKEQTESYKCGDYDFSCKASGNGIYGNRTWIYVMLIDSEVFNSAVEHVFNETKDKY
jgi:hypothetical protein